MKNLNKIQQPGLMESLNKMALLPTVDNIQGIAPKRGALYGEQRESVQMRSAWDIYTNTRAREIVRNKYTTDKYRPDWFATLGLSWWELVKRNTVPYFQGDAKTGFFNNLTLLGDTLDGIFTAPIKAGVSSAFGNGTYVETLKDYYGAGGKGRRSPSYGELIEDKYKINVHWTADLAMEILGDPSTYFGGFVTKFAKWGSAGDAGKTLKAFTANMMEESATALKTDSAKLMTRLSVEVGRNNVDEFVEIVIENSKKAITDYDARQAFKMARQEMKFKWAVATLSALEETEDAVLRGIGFMNPVGLVNKARKTKAGREFLKKSLDSIKGNKKFVDALKSAEESYMEFEEMAKIVEDVELDEIHGWIAAQQTRIYKAMQDGASDDVLTRLKRELEILDEYRIIKRGKGVSGDFFRAIKRLTAILHDGKAFNEKIKRGRIAKQQSDYIFKDDPEFILTEDVSKYVKKHPMSEVGKVDTDLQEDAISRILRAVWREPHLARFLIKNDTLGVGILKLVREQAKKYQMEWFRQLDGLADDILGESLEEIDVKQLSRVRQMADAYNKLFQEEYKFDEWFNKTVIEDDEGAVLDTLKSLSDGLRDAIQGGNVDKYGDFVKGFLDIIRQESKMDFDLGNLSKEDMIVEQVKREGFSTDPFIATLLGVLKNYKNDTIGITNMYEMLASPDFLQKSLDRYNLIKRYASEGKSGLVTPRRVLPLIDKYTQLRKRVTRLNGRYTTGVLTDDIRKEAKNIFDEFFTGESHEYVRTIFKGTVHPDMFNHTYMEESIKHINDIIGELQSLHKYSQSPFPELLAFIQKHKKFINADKNTERLLPFRNVKPLLEKLEDLIRDTGRKLQANDSDAVQLALYETRSTFNSLKPLLDSLLTRQQELAVNQVIATLLHRRSASGTNDAHPMYTRIVDRVIELGKEHDIDVSGGFQLNRAVDTIASEMLVKIHTKFNRDYKRGGLSLIRDFIQNMDANTNTVKQMGRLYLSNVQQNIAHVLGTLREMTSRYDWYYRMDGARVNDPIRNAFDDMHRMITDPHIREMFKLTRQQGRLTNFQQKIWKAVESRISQFDWYGRHYSIDQQKIINREMFEAIKEIDQEILQEFNKLIKEAGRPLKPIEFKEGALPKFKFEVDPTFRDTFNSYSNDAIPGAIKIAERGVQQLFNLDPLRKESIDIYKNARDNLIELSNELGIGANTFAQEVVYEMQSFLNDFIEFMDGDNMSVENILDLADRLQNGPDDYGSILEKFERVVYEVKDGVRESLMEPEYIDAILDTARKIQDANDRIMNELRGEGLQLVQMDKMATQFIILDEMGRNEYLNKLWAMVQGNIDEIDIGGEDEITRDLVRYFNNEGVRASKDFLEFEKTMNKLFTDLENYRQLINDLRSHIDVDYKRDIISNMKTAFLDAGDITQDLTLQAIQDIPSDAKWEDLVRLIDAMEFRFTKDSYHDKKIQEIKKQIKEGSKLEAEITDSYMMANRISHFIKSNQIPMTPEGRLRLTRYLDKQEFASPVIRKRIMEYIEDAWADGWYNMPNFNPRSLSNEIHYHLRKLILEPLKRGGLGTVYKQGSKLSGEYSVGTETKLTPQIQEKLENFIKKVMGSIRDTARSVKRNNHENWQLVSADKYRQTTKVSQKEWVAQAHLYKPKFDPVLKTKLDDLQKIYDIFKDIPGAGPKKINSFTNPEERPIFLAFEALAKELNIPLDLLTTYTSNMSKRTPKRIAYLLQFENLKRFADETGDTELARRLNEYFALAEKISGGNIEVRDRVLAGIMDSIDELRPPWYKDLTKNYKYQLGGKGTRTQLANATKTAKAMREMFDKYFNFFNQDASKLFEYMQRNPDKHLIVLRPGRVNQNGMELVKVKIESSYDLIRLMSSDNIVGYGDDHLFKLWKKMAGSKAILPPKVQAVKDLLVQKLKPHALVNVGFTINNFIDVITKNVMSTEGNPITVFRSMHRAVQWQDLYMRAYLEADELLDFAEFGYRIEHVWLDEMIKRFPDKWSEEEIAIIRAVMEFRESPAASSQAQELMEKAMKGKSVIGGSKKDSAFERFYKKWTYGKGPVAWNLQLNEQIEFVGRLGLHIDDLEKGMSKSESLNKILKVHFDYADKGLKELYAEFMIPFTSYFTRSFMFWSEKLSEDARTAEIVADWLMMMWEDEVDESDWNIYRMMRGAIPLGNDLALDAGLSFADALSLPGKMMNPKDGSKFLYSKANPLLKAGVAGVQEAFGKKLDRDFKDNVHRIPVISQIYQGSKTARYALSNQNKTFDEIAPSAFSNTFNGWEYRQGHRRGTYNFHKSIYTSKGLSRAQLMAQPLRTQASVRHRANNVQWMFRR